MWDVFGGQASHGRISYCLRNESKLEKLSGHIGGTQHCLLLFNDFSLIEFTVGSGNVGPQQLGLERSYSLYQGFCKSVGDRFFPIHPGNQWCFANIGFLFPGLTPPKPMVSLTSAGQLRSPHHAWSHFEGGDGLFPAGGMRDGARRPGMSDAHRKCSNIGLTEMRRWVEFI